jgi:hypothetical protein
MKSTLSIHFVLCLVFIGGLGSAHAQSFDISSGGTPTITGALNGSVTGSSSVVTNLSVTINFGEVSPVNANNIVKVIVPIAVRSIAAYQVSVTAAGSANANPQALQRSDIGFGANNLRPLGSNARVCTNSSHIFHPPFNNDPASNATINAAGRVVYPATLNNITSSTVILSGPRLSQTLQANRRADNGYVFDAILALTPQFFAEGSSSTTLTFTISAGPLSPC